MTRQNSSPENRGFRYVALAEMLQKDIEAGKYSVGEKLPSERVLAERLNTTHLTVRQGLDVLARKGLVRRELGSGTYVNATKAEPVIGIIFGPSLVDENAHFYRALLYAIEQEIAATPFICRSYNGINRTGSASPEKSLPFQELLRDSRTHPLKGCIQVSVDDLRWNESSPLEGVPLATYGATNRDVVIDYSFFGRKTIEHLAKNNRSRILYLRTSLAVDNDLSSIESAARRLHVAMPEVFKLDNDGSNLDRVAHDAVFKMANSWGRRQERPDAIIVSDDIATRGVATALLKAGISVPGDMALVTLANEGIYHHYGLEAVRYILSPREVARKLVHVLQSRIDGKPVESPQIITGGWMKRRTDMSASSKIS